ncbi:MAG: DNA-directed RNA polymerase subunit L [Thermoplasmata archaeon]
MNVKLISKEKDSIEVEVEGENETLLEPLKQKLLADDKVVAATYIIGHPLLDKPKIYVNVRDGKPQAALNRAAKALANDYKEFREILEKQGQL